MNLQIGQAIKTGLQIIIKNPVILKTVIFYALLLSIFNYFFAYTPEPEHFWLSTILFMSIAVFLSLIIAKMVYDVSGNNNVSLPTAINLSVKKVVPALIASALYLLILMFGLIALIIPGIFLMIKFAFVTYLILLNNEKILDSFKKSWQITTGNWWGVFGISVIYLIPVSVLSFTAIEIAALDVQIALVLDFISGLLYGWMISVLTIAYIQLMKPREMTDPAGTAA